MTTVIEGGERIEPGRGVYDARRAASLAGVPMSTLHYWARHGIYRPSISPGPRTRLWSWADLLALRAIDWFRSRKDDPDLPRVNVRAIRAAIDELEHMGLSRHDILHAQASRRGDLYLNLDNDLAVRLRHGGQIGSSDLLAFVPPYLHKGPDLLIPRPLLRIIPGKLHGEPHVRDTRISSAVIFTLYEQGYALGQIQRMYPDASLDALLEAIDLEESLKRPAA